MRLSEKQMLFAQDTARLFNYIWETGNQFTYGRAYDTPEEQQRLFDAGLSETLNSLHLKRLAIDLNIFVDGELTYDVDTLRHIGEFWKSLSPNNEWGGSWGWDAGHFQRNE
jgi:hypothetical protein